MTILPSIIYDIYLHTMTMMSTWSAGNHVWMELQSRTLCVRLDKVILL